MSTGTRFSPKQKRHLIIIDPQNDFCDPKTGTLFVPGADYDMKVRAPQLIRRVGDQLEDIHVTMDSHHRFHVAHPMTWWDYTLNRHPVTIPEGPPTVITAQMVRDGLFGPPPGLKKALGTRWLAYVESLEKHGRYVLAIWPMHCLIGTPGACIVPELEQALGEWEMTYNAIVDKITKGSNPYTEHYSALMADVPDPKDPSTQLNTGFIQLMADPEIAEIGLMGEALSHCLANTGSDLANNFGDENIPKLTLIEDCCSNVPGFESAGDKWIKDMVGRGMKRSTSVDWLR